MVLAESVVIRSLVSPPRHPFGSGAQGGLFIGRHFVKEPPSFFDILLQNRRLAHTKTLVFANHEENPLRHHKQV